MLQTELVFTDSVSETLKTYCSNHNITEAFILCDSNTQKYCLPLLGDTDFQVIEIPPGEQYKNLHSTETILNKLIQLGAGRSSVLINLGGGVVTDIGGFSASVYQRGIQFINIPTTLLAMVDAAIGGKTGIDHAHLKNFIGSFSPPKAVIISSEFLNTLDPDEIRSAWAEIIKTASIINAELFNRISEGIDLSEIIKSCAESKAELVQKDFKDENVRQLLNFGHTIGHAYESYALSQSEPVKHGYAVAKGMLFEIGLAEYLRILHPDDAKLIRQLISNKVSPLVLNDVEFKGLLDYISSDKKNRKGKITFSLPTAIGRGKYGVELSLDELKNWKNQGYI